MRSVRDQAYLDYIGANVSRARARAGMTQAQLAETAGLDLRFLQKVERGATNLSVLVVVALADALGVLPGSLFKKAVLPKGQRGRPRKKRRTP
jgi:transcriptional regulator with XRE-family HTH domain